MEDNFPEEDAFDRLFHETYGDEAEEYSSECETSQQNADKTQD